MDSHDSQTSVSLLDRARASEPHAWDRLAFLYTPLVFNWCRQCGISAEDAGDVAQEVFQKVFCSIQRFRRDRSGDTFRGWLWTITRNVIRDHVKAANAQPDAKGGTSAHIKLGQLPDQEPHSTDSADIATDPLLLRGLELVRAEFEEKTWQAFWRFAVDGVKAVDVADELETTPGAVRKAKLRVMRRLKEELGGLLDGLAD